MSGRIGVCSWSLRPDSPHDLAAKVLRAGVSRVQLALDPFREGRWSIDATRTALVEAGITVCSGMMRTRGEDYTTLDSIRRTGGLRPDAYWEDTLRAARGNADLARELGLDLVTFHAGFLPPDRSDALRRVMIDRLRAIADVFADRGVRAGLETGQERAETLEDVLSALDRSNVGVNFDPANMILYGMGNPVGALERLAPRVMQMHVKDAVAARTPGAWGTEVAAGQGDVDWDALFGVLRRAGIACDFLIERESGARQADDIRAARDLVLQHLAT